MIPPTNQNILPTPSINICMMCKNRNDGNVHEDANLVDQTDFCDVKALASRLIVGIHVDEIEKKLLSWKESRPQIFDNICLYSEICYILSMSNVRINAQRFLHDLFSDCHFQKLRNRYRQTDGIREEDDDDEPSVTTSYF